MASDTLKNLPAERLASAIDLTKCWDGAYERSFFSPEAIKAAGGAEKYLRGEYLTPPVYSPEPGSQTIMMFGRRVGKSALADEYFKMINETARSRPAETVRGAGYTFVSVDELSGIDASKIENLKGNIMARNKIGQSSLSPEALIALEDMAQKMTNVIGTMKSTNKRVTVASPANLTVHGAKGFRKKNHLGGEEFEMIGVRVGSALTGSRLIFEFKPTSVVDYATMEMTQDECESNLNDWRQLADMAVGRNFYMALEEVRKIDTTKLQEIERARLSQEYGEFGAW